MLRNSRPASSFGNSTLASTRNRAAPIRVRSSWAHSPLPSSDHDRASFPQDHRCPVCPSLQVPHPRCEDHPVGVRLRQEKPTRGTGCSAPCNRTMRLITEREHCAVPESDSRTGPSTRADQCPRAAARKAIDGKKGVASRRLQAGPPRQKLRGSPVRAWIALTSRCAESNCSVRCEAAAHPRKRLAAQRGRKASIQLHRRGVRDLAAQRFRKLPELVLQVHHQSVGPALCPALCPGLVNQFL